MVTWIIGLAGAGKTTIGRHVWNLLKQQRPNVVFLDGDHVRKIMGDDLGHTLEDRRKNAWRICHLCQFLDQQGIDVVCSILSLFREHQQWNRDQLSEYFEVYVRVAIEELERRDQKKLYSRARAGEIKDVAGIDLPFEPPSAHLIIDNHQPFADPEQLAHQIIEEIKGSSYDPHRDRLSLHQRESA